MWRMFALGLLLAVMLTAPSGHVDRALAVDTITSSDAPDLTSVRAKIKAKDFVFHRCVISLHPSLPPNEDSSTATERGAILCRYYRTLPTRC